MKIKKGLSILLCLATAFQLMSFPASAKSAVISENKTEAIEKIQNSLQTVSMEKTMDMTKPVITITPANENYKGGMYCQPPVITVHDEGSNLISVTASSISDSVQGEIVNGTDCTISIEGKNGASWTVNAIDDAGNEAIEKFYVGHQPMGRQIVKIEPTCTENGINIAYSTCAHCGERFVFYTYGGDKALGHQPDKNSPQTMTPCGEHVETITVYPCIRCQALLTEQGALYEVQDGQGHVWESKTDKISCDVPGTSYEQCSRCNITRNVKTIPASGHSFENWNIKTPADCSTGTVGERERICTKCNKKEVQPIPASHTWSDRIELKAATCTDAGYTGFKCTVCNQENPEHHIEIKPLGHSYADDGDCTTESVCSREGCGQKLPAKQHSWGEYEYDRTGHWQKCSNEGCTKTTKDINGGAEPHANAQKNQYCTDSYNCLTCGYNVTGYSSHMIYGNWKSDGSYHWLQCSREGCSYKQNMGVHEGRDDGNCTTEWICKVCKRTLQEAMTHNWSDDYTYTVNVHRRRCTNPGCNQVTDIEEHTFITETYDCTKGVICSKCDYVAVHGESGHRFANSAYYGDDNGHWQVCTNKNCKVKSDVKYHNGGKATCRDKAVCETCHTPYGELDAQNHVGETEFIKMKEATVEEEGYTGDEICISCKAVIREGKKIPKLEKPCEHSWITEYDDIKSWQKCTTCNAVQNERDHTFTKWLNDDNEHWQQCEYCEHTTHHAQHVLNTDAVDKNCNTPIMCNDCGYIMIAAKEHVFGDSWAYDEDGHWHVCTNDDCEQTSKEIPHAASDDGNCTTALVCSDCGHTLIDAQAEHVWSSVWKSDATGHYHECENDGCTQRQYEDHVEAADDNLCTTPIVCEVCNWLMKEGAESHDFGQYDQYQYDESGHWNVCLTPGCKGCSQEVAHSGGKATCAHAAVCDICKQSYGNIDPEQHAGGVEIKGYEAPTEEKEGYTGDTYCIGCNNMIATGEVINKLSPEHVHVFDYNKEHGIYAADDVSHWLECPCGARAEVTEHTYGELKKDNTHHWDECTVCGKIWREDHVYENGRCAVCGAEQHEHEHEFQWKCDENIHWQECSTCGDRKETQPHVGGTATCVSKAVCTDCGQAYGEKNPANHTGKTEVRGQKEATAKDDGYTGDLCCTDCEQVLKKGTVIPKLGDSDSTKEPTDSPIKEPDKQPNETSVPKQESTSKPAQTPEPAVSDNKNSGILAKVSENTTLDSTLHSVKISWKADKDATAGYRIYLKSGKKYVKAATVKAGVTSVKIKKIGKKRLKPGTTYKVRVVSLKRVEGKIRTGKKIAYTTATKPVTPKWSLMRHHKGTKMILKWKKVSGASGYEIQMSTKAHTGYKTIKRSDASKTSYTKTKLSGKTKYYFRIRAYKKVTGRYVYSTWRHYRSGL